MGQLFIQSQHGPLHLQICLYRYPFFRFCFCFFLFVSFILLYFSLQCYMLPQVLEFQITTMKLAQNTALLL